MSENNWFKVKNGLVVSGGTELSGSVRAYSITSSLLGTASYANNAKSASYSVTASYAHSVISASYSVSSSRSEIATFAISSNCVTGSGTNNYHAKWINTNTLTESIAMDNGINMGIGLPSTTYLESVYKLHIGTYATNSAYWVNTISRPEILYDTNQTSYIIADNPALTYIHVSASVTQSGYGIASDNSALITNNRHRGLLDTIYGERIQVGIYNVSGTINTAFGTSIQPFSLVGRVNTLYCLHIASPYTDFGGTIGNGYAIYSATTYPSYFGGNIGIKTTAASSSLTVFSTANTNDNALLIYNNNTSANSYTAIGSYYTPGNTNVNSQIRFGNEQASGAPSYLAFATSTTNSPTERVRITSAGNVGIGTTSPSNKLHVFSGSITLDNGYSLYGRSSDAVDEILLSISTGNNVQLLAPTLGGSMQYNIRNATGNHQWLAGGSSRMQLSNAGNLSVGIDNPNSAYRIDANGSIRMSGSAASSRYLWHANGQILVGADTTGYYICAGASGPQIPIFVGDGQAKEIRFSTVNDTCYFTQSRFGIGVSSPTAKLHVNGNVIATSYTGSLQGPLLGTASYALTASYSISTTQQITSSQVTVISASWASSSLSSSYVRTLHGLDYAYFLTASNIGSGILPSSRLSGSYPMSSSWAISASIATTASYANNSDTLDNLDSTYFTNASNLSTGTVPSGRLSGTYTITSSYTNSASMAITAAYSANADTLDTLDSTYFLNASNLSAGTVPSARLAGTYSITSSWATTAVSATNADTLDSLNSTYFLTASNMAHGILPAARLTGSYSITASRASAVTPNSVALGNDTTGDYVANVNVDTTNFTLVNGTGESSQPTISLKSQVTVTGLTASLYGTAALASNSTALGGQASSFFTDASNLSSGILPSARLSGFYTITASNASHVQNGNSYLFLDNSNMTLNSNGNLSIYAGGGGMYITSSGMNLSTNNGVVITTVDVGTGVTITGDGNSHWFIAENNGNGGLCELRNNGDDGEIQLINAGSNGLIQLFSTRTTINNLLATGSLVGTSSYANEAGYSTTAGFAAYATNANEATDSTFSSLAQTSSCLFVGTVLSTVNFSTFVTAGLSPAKSLEGYLQVQIDGVTKYLGIYS